jgi:hypothetical protein
MIDALRQLAQAARIRITLHARSEMDADLVSTDDLVLGLAAPTSDIIEDYPDDPRGHSHLVLAWLPAGKPIHVCCAIHEETLVVITVYRPDAARWYPDWRTRR